jgi:hypothetical protein
MNLCELSIRQIPKGVPGGGGGGGGGGGMVTPGIDSCIKVKRKEVDLHSANS